jgi:hypothetical protein
LRTRCTEPKFALFLQLVHVGKRVHICVEANASPLHIRLELKRPMVPHNGVGCDHRVLLDRSTDKPIRLKAESSALITNDAARALALALVH